MARRHIEQLEVVFVGLHFRAFVNLEAHFSEDLVDVAQHARGDMQFAERLRTARQGHIDAFRAPHSL